MRSVISGFQLLFQFTYKLNVRRLLMLGANSNHLGKTKNHVNHQKKSDIDSVSNESLRSVPRNLTAIFQASDTSYTSKRNAKLPTYCSARLRTAADLVAPAMQQPKRRVDFWGCDGHLQKTQ